MGRPPLMAVISSGVSATGRLTLGGDATERSTVVNQSP